MNASDNGKVCVADVEVLEVGQHIIEIISDSGEGAQTAGKTFGTTSARMGNGVWTVEIIPAEIEPPARSREGASGNRIRIGTELVTNMGDQADVVVAFNEQVLYSRIDVNALRSGTEVFLEGKWAGDPRPKVRQQYAEALADFAARGYAVREVPMEERCLQFTENPQRGKNMWVVGMLCALYEREVAIVEEAIEKTFRRKGQEVVEMNLRLLQDGYAWGLEHLERRYRVPIKYSAADMLVLNGNEATALGVMAAGIELCSMYPITPATSVSHYLAKDFHQMGGFVHQAEDEIAAIGFALGASYAGKTALTVTSGPGMALKTEFLGLAVMAEIPLVVIDVQRGGPSTGLPTRVEQGDLLHAYFAQPGDAPKIVLAPSTIEECFTFIPTARTLAEQFRGPVIVLTDANLATGVSAIQRPAVPDEWFAGPVDQTAWDSNVPPFDWDAASGLSARPIPGMPGGNYVLTGLAHNRLGQVAYESATNQHAIEMRSRKLAALQKSLKVPEIFGDDAGDLLVVGWGSTWGAINEAVSGLQAAGHRVSHMHIKVVSPLPGGLTEAFSRFRRVMTIEINYSDEPGVATVEGRRRSQLSWLLRAQTLVDVDCWSRVPGTPLAPWMIREVVLDRLQPLSGPGSPGPQTASARH